MTGDRLGWLIQIAVSLASLLACVTLIGFMAIYTLKYWWERSNIGRGIVAVGTAILVAILGDLARLVGWGQLGDLLTAVGYVWLSVVLVLGFVSALRGADFTGGGLVATPREPSSRDTK